MEANLIPAIKEYLQIDLPDSMSNEVLLEKLSSHINHLIQSDFQKLISVLYRVDVDEKKLKQLLEDNSERDAGTIIAELIVERQLQKIRSRQQYKPDENISEDEKW